MATKQMKETKATTKATAPAQKTEQDNTPVSILKRLMAPRRRTPSNKKAGTGAKEHVKIIIR